MAGIAQRLKEAMEAKGLKQVDVIRLAEPIGREYNVRIGKSHMSQYLSGKSEPRKDILGVLAKTLEVDESWLAGEVTVHGQAGGLGQHPPGGTGGDDCVAGKLSLEEFVAWLDSDRQS